MVSHSAGNQDRISGLTERTGQLHTLRDEANTARVDEYAIAMTTVDHLGITRHNTHARFTGGFGHALADSLKVGY